MPSVPLALAYQRAYSSPLRYYTARVQRQRQRLTCWHNRPPAPPPGRHAPPYARYLVPSTYITIYSPHVYSCLVYSYRVLVLARDHGFFFLPPGEGGDPGYYRFVRCKYRPGRPPGRPDSVNRECKCTWIDRGAGWQCQQRATHRQGGEVRIARRAVATSGWVGLSALGSRAPKRPSACIFIRAIRCSRTRVKLQDPKRPVPRSLLNRGVLGALIAALGVVHSSGFRAQQFRGTAG